MTASKKRPDSSVPMEVKVVLAEGDLRNSKVKVIPSESEKMIDAKEKKMSSLHRRRIMIKTFFNSLSLFILGLMLSMKGPSFMDLQNIVDTDVEGGSAFFTASAFGYMIGSLIAGAIYNRVQSKSLLMLIPMTMAGITFALTPYCEDFVLMIFVQAVVSLFSAIFETTANTEEVSNWEGQSDSAMQFLSFTYSLGGIIGPLIVEPFLAPMQNTSDSTNAPASSPSNTYGDANENVFSDPVTSRGALSNDSELLSGSSFYASSALHQLSDETRSSKTLNIASRALFNATVSSSFSAGNGFDSINPLDTLKPTDQETRIHDAYLITGLLSVVAAIPFLILYLKSRHVAANSNKRSDGDQHCSLDVESSKAKLLQKGQQKLPFKVYVVLTGLLSIFYFFYTTVDDPFSMYLSLFVVKHLSWTKEHGALVSSIYWGSSTVTKLAMVVLVRHVDTGLVLLVSTVGMTLSTLLLTVFSWMYLHAAVWAATALLALSQSAVFGGGFAWADSNLIRMDGKVTSCVMIFASLGAMVDPMLLGACMKAISPMSFPILLTAQSFITCVLFLLMLWVARPFVFKHYGPPRGSYETQRMMSFDSKDVRKKNEIVETSEDDTRVGLIHSSTGQDGVNNSGLNSGQSNNFELEQCIHEGVNQQETAGGDSDAKEKKQERENGDQIPVISSREKGENPHHSTEGHCIKTQNGYIDNQ